MFQFWLVIWSDLTIRLVKHLNFYFVNNNSITFWFFENTLLPSLIYIFLTVQAVVRSQLLHLLSLIKPVHNFQQFI